MGCVVLCLVMASLCRTQEERDYRGKGKREVKGGVVVILKMSQNEFPHRLVGRGCNANTDATHDSNTPQYSATARRYFPHRVDCIAQ